MKKTYIVPTASNINVNVSSIMAVSFRDEETNIMHAKEDVSCFSEEDFDEE